MLSLRYVVDAAQSTVNISYLSSGGYFNIPDHGIAFRTVNATLTYLASLYALNLSTISVFSPRLARVIYSKNAPLEQDIRNLLEMLMNTV